MKVISETMGNATLPSESQTPFQRFSKEMSGKKTQDIQQNEVRKNSKGIALR